MDEEVFILRWGGYDKGRREFWMRFGDENDICLTALYNKVNSFNSGSDIKS